MALLVLAGLMQSSAEYSIQDLAQDSIASVGTIYSQQGKLQSTPPSIHTHSEL